MKNGTQNGTRNSARAKQAAPKPKLPPKPVLPELHWKNGMLTEAEAALYNEYIVQLRDWLWALPDARFDRERRKLSPTDLNYINCLNTYESYQNGGQMREVVESRF